MLYYYEKDPDKISPLKKIIFVMAGIIGGFFICRTFMGSFVLKDNSMLPQYKKGDTVIILKRTEPSIGDAVLLSNPLEQKKVLFKRVIAGANDTVEIRNKVFYINSKRVTFKWKTKSGDKRIFPAVFSYRDNMPPIRLGENEYFLIGDNIDFSFDSRTFGPVKDDLIIGKAIYKY